MSEFLAHSAKFGRAAEPYEEHVREVCAITANNFDGMARYAPEQFQVLRPSAMAAAVYHDLGKLESSNQATLAGKMDRKHLPFPHADAGVAHLLRLGDDAFVAAYFVYSHHRGLDDFSTVGNQNPLLRDKRTAERTDQILSSLLMRHRETRAAMVDDLPPLNIALAASDFRVMFGCLVDGDHADTARVMDGISYASEIPLNPSARKKSLETYINKRMDEFKRRTTAPIPEQQNRMDLRNAFFAYCLDSENVREQRIEYCDAPVGSGKTTAVMARLLSVAEKRGLRRVIVVLPFTNIIAQSVKVYREALCLQGENPQEVVAEIHHLADFDDSQSRHLTPLWTAPIIVTTAVAFFETLAANRPSTLRRICNLPGSVVFLDEAHAMLPLALLPIAWLWMNHFAETWNCHWVIGSGSLVKFWEYQEIKETVREHDSPIMRNILPDSTSSQLMAFENRRIEYRNKPDSFSLEQFAQWIRGLPGPILVVVNTVATAASLAKKLRDQAYFGMKNIYHLSTALSPKDRASMVEQVKKRLMARSGENWCLIATSCVEAGIDFSFRTGVRECSSILSLLQLAGRVNRNSEYGDSIVWTIRLNEERPFVVENPAYAKSAAIFWEVIVEKGRAITPELCTELVKRELRETINGANKVLPEKENAFEFEYVAQHFHVINDDSFPVVVDSELISKIDAFEDVDWRDIQMGSVSIRRGKMKEYAVRESLRYPGLYLWTLNYDSMLGYMSGVLDCAEFTADGMSIV